MHLSVLAATTLVALAAAPAVTHAAIPTTMSSTQPYGLRGLTIPFTVTLKANGEPVADHNVCFYDWSDRRPNGTYRGVIRTNNNGKATLYCTIPTNPAEDNDYLKGVFDGNATLSWFYSYKRIQLGRPYP